MAIGGKDYLALLFEQRHGLDTDDPNLLRTEFLNQVL